MVKVYTNEEKQDELITITPTEVRQDFSGQVKNELTGGIFADDSKDKPQILGLDEYILPKTEDKTLTATAALQDDDHFTFYGEANESYLIDLMVFWNFTTNGADGLLEFNFSLPTGATYDGQISPGNAIEPTSISEATNVEVTNNPGGSRDIVTIIRGVVKTGSVSGQVTWQWGCDKNNPTNTVTVTVYKGSWMRYRKLPKI